MTGMHEIVGCEDLKKELKRSFKRMINTDWSKSKRIPPKGIILYGPPGTGKTTIMKAILSEYVTPYDKFIHLNLNKKVLADKNINLTGDKIDKLFLKIKEDSEKIYILTIDEADDIFMARTAGRAYAGELTSNLLNNIEGLSSPTNFYMIAATNYIDHVDLAIRDRLDKQIKIDYPTKEELRKLYLMYIISDFEICDYSEAVLNNWVEHSNGFTGRDITHIANSLEDIQYDLQESNPKATINSSIINFEITQLNQRKMYTGFGGNRHYD